MGCDFALTRGTSAWEFSVEDFKSAFGLEFWASLPETEDATFYVRSIIDRSGTGIYHHYHIFDYEYEEYDYSATIEHRSDGDYICFPYTTTSLDCFIFRIKNIYVEVFASLRPSSVESDDIDTVPVITTASLPDGSEGTAYSQTLTVSGDIAVTWSITSGDLPSGLTLSEDGTISGTPTESGTFTFTVLASNSSGSDTKTLSITITSSASSTTAPSITTSSLTEGVMYSAYSASLEASGTSPITWSLADGTLPDGLILSEDGTISGTPTEGGVFSFTVSAANSAGSDSATLSITITYTAIRAPKITTTSLTSGYTGSSYGAKLTATGTSITWSADNLPDGLTLSTSGYLSGTPTTAGTYSITVQASNSAGKDSATLSLTITEPASGTKPSITTSELDSAGTGTAYSFQLMASGTPSFTWSVTKGKLPDGLTLSSSGLISGTPAKKGKKKFTVTAENSSGKDSKALTLTVNELPAITTETLKDATVGKKYNAAFKAKGTAPLTWTFDGYLPDGLTLDEAKHKITGTPTINTTGEIQVTVSNSTGEVTKVFTLTANATAPTISTKTLKKGTWGKAYKAAIKAKGTNPVTLTLSGTLPSGLEFDGSTITGTPSEVCDERAISITASNMGGSVTKDYTLTIQGVAPKITTKSLANATQGSEYSAALAATGSPTITWEAEGLPSGLSIASDGTISGTPSESGKFKVTVKAANTKKTVKKNLKLTVAAASGTSSQTALAPKADSVLEETYSDYVIVAELGTVSVDKAGMYDFTVSLSGDVMPGGKLLWLANSSEPSDDDEIAEFYDSDGEETDYVSADRVIVISVWLNPKRIYSPAIAVR